MKRRIGNLLASGLLHALIVLSGWILVRKPEERLAKPAPGWTVEVSSESREGTSTSSRGLPRRRAVDLRPGFAKGGKLFDRRPPGVAPSSLQGSEGIARELLHTESKVFQVFDLLAAKIGSRLDYPDALAENGIQGVATLDLYFDSRGEIDESRSRCLGGHGMMRGLMVRAAREGIVAWYRSDAGRLSREQFRNQHFRAEFVISGLLRPTAEWARVAPGSYSFLRRKPVSTCLAPDTSGTGVMLDFACLAVQAAGAIKRNMSGSYRSRFLALRESLELFDRMELNGLNALIRERS